jgi:hypothetical protein
MTFKELGDDAQAKIEAFVTYSNLTTANLVLAISEALHEMQKRTQVMETTLTIVATSLDSTGAYPLPRNITVPRRGTYAMPGSAISAPCKVQFIGRDLMAQRRLNYQYSQHLPRNVIFACIEQNNLYFFPFQGLQGTFTLSCVQKMPIYAISAAADTTSFWYEWTNDSALDTKYTNTLIPQEFEDALTGLTYFVSAKLLTLIPGWKRKFESDYNEFMAKFEEEAGNVKDNLPNYELNTYPHMDYGW